MKRIVRKVYTIHEEKYSFELTPETIKEIERYANYPWNVEKWGEIKDITEEEIISLFGQNRKSPILMNTREARICDALDSYLWDQDYEDEYICNDDGAPWEDEIIED